MMNNREMWERYASAWRAKDRTTKLAELDRSVAQHAVYCDPVAECRGHDERHGREAARRCELR
jgi:hypothetical protein